MIVTRFAPSPTGLLHLGHALAAITAHESGDDFLLRIEDIDKGRSRDKFIESIFFDLKWLGLSWDEPSLRQSTRMGAYAEALVNLKMRGLVYSCFCTRAEIAAEIARAGADTFVAGSAIFGAKDYKATIAQMRGELAKVK